MRAAFLMFAAFAFALAVPIREDPTPKEAKPSPDKQIMDDWQDDRNNYVLRFLPSESVFIINGQPSPGDGLTANVVIDWSKDPVAIDFMPKQRGGKMMGILKIEGDRLTVCVRTNGNTRPTVFDPQDLLLNYRRLRK